MIDVGETRGSMEGETKFRKNGSAPLVYPEILNLTVALVSPTYLILSLCRTGNAVS